MNSNARRHQLPPLAHSRHARPFGIEGAWQTSDYRYRLFARQLMTELEAIAAAITLDWPPDLSEGITSREQHPDLWDRCDHRDRLSDSVRVYAAMSIEGFLNFYGVYRLGQLAYERQVVNKPLFYKLQALLKMCDGVSIEAETPIAKALQVVSRSRNLLVHPIARELSHGNLEPHAHVPSEARAVVAAMESFFTEFKRLVPDAAFLVDRSSDA